MATSKPLQLEAAPSGQGPTWRRNAAMIDALPYIDPLPEDEKRQVEALITEECRRSGKRPADYLAELPPMPKSRLDSHPVLQAELTRVEEKKPMASLDTSRYRLEPPPMTKRNDPNAWKAALDNAHAQLEHQYTRIQNLELLLKNGDKSWRAQTQLGEATLHGLEAQLSAARKAVMSLNQERKLSQTAAGSELGKLHHEYMSLVAQNFEIDTACDALEQEIATLKARLEGGQEGQQGQDGQPAENGVTVSSAQQSNGSVATTASVQGNGHAASTDMES